MTAGVGGAFKALVRAVTREKAWSREILYHRKIGAGYDPIGQQSGDEWETATLSAVVGPGRAKPGRGGAAGLGEDLAEFLVAQAGLDFEPRLGDGIECEGRTYRVIAVDGDRVGAAYRLTGRLE